MTVGRISPVYVYRGTPQGVAATYNHNDHHCPSGVRWSWKYFQAQEGSWADAGYSLRVFCKTF